MTVQSLDRGLELLRLIVQAGKDGRRLVELQRETGLTKPTVHRLLATLKRHALVEQHEESRRYVPGPEVAILGWSATQHLNEFKELCSNEMIALANETGDTSFLVVRSGFETICIDRQTGAYPVKAFTIDVGARRPLGIGATGLALLASLPQSQLDEAFATIEPMVRHYPLSIGKIRVAVNSARRAGYAVSDGSVLKMVRGVAVSIRDDTGKVVGAIGLAAIKERLSEGRLPELVRILRRNVRQIEERIARTEQRPAAEGWHRRTRA